MSKTRFNKHVIRYSKELLYKNGSLIKLSWLKKGYDDICLHKYINIVYAGYTLRLWVLFLLKQLNNQTTWLT